MDSAAWDARYAGSELVWGSEPNRFVAAELAGLPPGRALDVACGEGRNAIWLATRGWHATGVDFSATAVERAGRLAADAGVAQSTEFVIGDVVAGPLPTGPFDAVLVAYLQLPASPRRAALRQAAQALAPAGGSWSSRTTPQTSRTASAGRRTEGSSTRPTTCSPTWTGSP